MVQRLNPDWDKKKQEYFVEITSVWKPSNFMQ